ncbi:MAG: sulfatase-like hydrolase/transferase [Verrucomicrobia bacterium]|nr:sulfatase-like hydrolase/transferase [Verrucomicrobiota bacterium]
MTNRPNLIFITTDQQRWDATGIYGNPVIRTPHMDRLGREGVVFDRCYCASPYCVATRASLMTGHSHHHEGHIRGHAILNPDNTVPARLGRAGYFTQAIGKMHFAPVTEFRKNGFDSLLLSEEMRWVRFASSAGDVRLDDYDRYLVRHGLWGWEKPPEIGYNEIKPLINHIPKEHHVTRWCGDRTVEFLNSKPRQPFYLWCSFIKPHVPYDCPVHLKDWYDPARMPAPWVRKGELDEYPYYGEYQRLREFHLYSEAVVGLARACYYANISFIDEQVGRILDALEQTAQDSQTVVIFSSDHGDMMGDHGLWFKTLGYEGSVRIPLMIRAPGLLSGGQRVAAPVSHFDVAETLLALGGASEESLGRPGADLRNILNGRIKRDFVVSAEIGFYLCHRDWKYNFYPNGGYEELFDLREDPHELANLAKSSSRASTRRGLRLQLATWLKQHATGSGLDAGGDLEARPYQPPAPLGHNPFSRMPWESRVPPSALRERGQKPGWWWEQNGADLSSLLPPKARNPQA